MHKVERGDSFKVDLAGINTASPSSRGIVRATQDRDCGLTGSGQLELFRLNAADPVDGLRLVFFISAYRSSTQLGRLVSTLQRAEPESTVVIHDSFACPLDPALFDAVPGVHVIRTASPIVWGDMSLETARWDVFRWILHNLDADWVVLLSEQDYPIAPLRELRLRLISSGADAVIRGRRLDEIDQDARRLDCTLRYLYRYASFPRLGVERRLPAVPRRIVAGIRRRLYAAVNRSQRKVVVYRTPDTLQLSTRIGVRQRKTPFSAAFPCWSNDCWFAISRKAIEHVVGYVDSHPDFVRYYARTVIPLESATGTIVFNDPELKVANVSLHAIRFTDPGSGRPDVFTLDDLDYLRSSGAVFARKFDERNADVLDALDETVLGDREEAS